MTSYSQNHEDLIIYGYFNGFKGKLLEIGANNGIDLSNSRLLIEQGWRAVLVEPSLAFGKLESLYQSSESVRLCNIGISDSYAQHEWYELTDSLLSTKNKELADSWGLPYETVKAQFVPYAEIEQDYDFISIDAEAEDWIILQQIDLSLVRCLCIEYGKYETEIRDYCARYGMNLLYRNGENLIFTR